MERNRESSPPRALTIAGSDSGGGAGIQADLKTFAALGVHGMSAITAITAQNTIGVTDILGIPPETVASQIEAVYSDIGFDALKTGMLFSSDIIKVVSRFLRRQDVRKRNVPVVVDPVMVSKSGARLLKSDAVDSLVHDLLPLADVVTPNAEEARILVGSKERVSTSSIAQAVARKILRMGPRVVIIKGGHMTHLKSEVVDLAYFKDDRSRTLYLKGKEYATKNTHGTGCVFASAIAAGLARQEPIDLALENAKKFVGMAIENSLTIGRGAGPVNPSGSVRDLAERYLVCSNVSAALGLLHAHGKEISPLIPELRTNIGMGIEDPRGYEDIAAIPGRITALSPNKIAAHTAPEFGASKHIANAILASARRDPSFRAAMNIRYSEELIRVCRNLGLRISSYDRRLEPPEVKRKEGASTFWGASTAIAKSGPRFPDIIYHEGDYGKEPMIVILGRDAISVAQTAIRIGASALEKKRVMSRKKKGRVSIIS